MAQYTNIGPIELTDDELKAVAGGDFGSSVSITNSANSGNMSGNITNSGNNAVNSFN
jgi:hypothetical protein